MKKKEIFAGLLLIITLGMVVSIIYVKGKSINGSLDEEWIQSAQSGNPESQRSLALVFEFGDGFAELNYSEAVYWYKLAAVQGDSIAQENLSRLYLNGKGVEKDLVCAFFWSKVSGNQSKVIEDIERKLSSEEISIVDSVIEFQKEHALSIKDINHKSISTCIKPDTERLTKKFVNCSIEKGSDTKKCIWAIR